MDVSTFNAFSDEVRKIAARPMSGPLRGVRARDLALVGVGAGGLYAGKRLYDDIKAGEQLRRQQRGY